MKQAWRTVHFNYTFFPRCSHEWNNWSDDTKSLSSPVSFKKILLSFVKTSENSFFAIHDNSGVKLLTRLRLNFSRLNEYNFSHNFLDTINPIYSCCSELETAAYFLLRRQNHVINSSTLLKNVFYLGQTLWNCDDDHVIHILLYCSEKLKFNLNKEIIKLTVCYLKDTERFDESLIWNVYRLFLLFLIIITIIIILLYRDVDFWHIFTITLKAHSLDWAVLIFSLSSLMPHIYVYFFLFLFFFLFFLFFCFILFIYIYLFACFVFYCYYYYYFIIFYVFSTCIGPAKNV